MTILPTPNRQFFCSCGESWNGCPPPPKFRTQAYADRELAKWLEKHGPGKCGCEFRIEEK